MTHDPDWLSIADVARRLSVSQQCVRRWVKAGDVRADGDMVLASSLEALIGRSIQRPVPDRPWRRGVYFVRVHEFIKIGHADNVRSRWSNGGTDTPYQPEPLGYIQSDSPGGLERELHQRFARWRHRGEWFRASATLLQFIAEEAKPWPK